MQQCIAARCYSKEMVEDCESRRVNELMFQKHKSPESTPHLTGTISQQRQ